MFYLCYLYSSTCTGVQHHFHIRCMNITTGVTSRAGTAFNSGAYLFPPFSGVCVAQSFVCCVVFCRSLLVLFSFNHCGVCPSSFSHCGVCPSSFSHCGVCPSSFSHCGVCPSSIYSFSLPICYLQTFI